MVRLHGRWCENRPSRTLIHLLYAHGLQPEAQVVRLRQVVRPRLLNDWTELLKQFPACSQMVELLLCSQSDYVGSQPGWGLLHDWTVLAGPGGSEALTGLQPDG